MIRGRRQVRFFRAAAMTVSAIVALLSCGRGGDSVHVTSVTLNDKALEWLWQDLDSSARYAQMAMEQPGAGNAGRAQALNTLARVEYMRMDYAKATDLYLQVLDMHSSIAMQLTANIGLMRICQRTSDNVAFYEYRNRILLLLRTMHDEENLLSQRDLAKLESLERSFRMESAYYYHELGQAGQAAAEMQQVSSDAGLRNDMDRWLMFLYLRGLGTGLEGGENAAGERLLQLEQCLGLALDCGNRRMQTMAACALSSLLLENGRLQHSDMLDYALLERATGASVNCDDAVSLPYSLALSALGTAASYSAYYEMVEAYCRIAACQTAMGQYGTAIETLDKAMELAGTAHAPGDAPVGIPASVASVHELMSVAWSGLDSTRLSDLNRDRYLEIQKNMRLDRRYEARHALLEQTNDRLSLLIVCIGLAIAVLLLVYVVLLRRVGKANRLYAGVMQQCVGLCRTILQPVAPDCLDRHMQTVVAPAICRLTGAAGARVVSPGKLEMDWGGSRPDAAAQAVVSTVSPFLEQAYSSLNMLVSQADSLEQASKQHYLYLMHRAKCKRENLDRRACCQVLAQCLPWIDRMKERIERLQDMDPGSPEYESCMEYVRELAAMTIRFNDVLARWIEIRKGAVSLNVSSFPIQDVLDIVAGGASAFRIKGVELEVSPSAAVVRADRVLTLFMINTLADNARKYTPRGGRVSIGALELDDCVEIAVTDTGIGLSQSDVERINGDKILDAGTIGAGPDAPDAAVSGSDAHGSGFGLMNCKGIIDKYIKSHPMFSVCRFHVESREGQGSRFSFRLPKGVVRTLSLLAALLSIMLPARGQTEQNVGQTQQDSLLVEAYYHAWNAYELNVQGDRSAAVAEAGLAFDMLNRDYLEHGGQGRLLSLRDSLAPAEIEWISQGYATDYETVLWMRNELAVSALALKDWELYKYNDNAYLDLFKRYFSDGMMEQDCTELQHSNSNKSIALILFVVVLLTAFLVLFVIYARNWIRYRSDLKQMLEIVSKIRQSLDATGIGTHDVRETIQAMCDSIFPEMDSLLGLKGLGMELVDGDRTVSVASSGELEGRLSGNCLDLPLVNGADTAAVGTLKLALKGREPADMHVVQMICDYLATALQSMLLRFESGFNDLNRMNGESAQMKMEQERLHVNNMVLDNCLSTLKHETVWYPSRIMQLAQSHDGADMLELVRYYRNMFGILSQQALEQTRMPLVQPETLDCGELVGALVQNLAHSHPDFALEVEPIRQLSVKADAVLAAYLLETLVTRSISSGCTGPIRITVTAEGGFIRFDLLCPGLSANPDTLFSPLENADSMAFVLCSRIIREHDESLGHIGCRINAESRAGGLLIWFTLPEL